MPTRTMFVHDPTAGVWDFAEGVGVAHAAQVVGVPAGALVRPTRLGDGTMQAVLQPSQSEPGLGYLHLRAGLPADARLRLRPVDGEAEGPVTATRVDGGWELDNGRCAVRLVADGTGAGADGIHPGPVRAMRVGAGPWRGATWLDVRSPTCRWSCALVEAGPVRAVWRGRAELAGGRWYLCEATLDADQPGVRIVERSGGARGDQMVWDFAGADLPGEWLQLDSGAGHACQRPHWGIDRRLARLAPWTQFSQINDFADGFAVDIGGDVVGAVALAGGAWRGRRLDHLEAWVRRFADPLARRGEPADAKADLSHPDQLAARGAAVERAHLCWEGWIGPDVERRWFLALAPRTAVDPPGGPDAGRGLGHFEDRPDPEAWRAQQGLLRRIHIQLGLAPLQEQLAWTVDLDELPAAQPLWPHPLLATHHETRAVMPPRGSEEGLDDYVAARVLGFWQGSGAAFTNVVVGRRIAPEMLHLERLTADGAADPLRRARWRARLLFLAHLFASDHYYPGDASMRPLGDADGMEPTFQGMANQNFLTDAFCVHGMAAEVFPHHPCAAAWRSRAVALWSRQLDYHMHASGVWEESHTYFQHVLNTVLPWLLRRGDGCDDPRLHRLLEAGLQQLAPPDAGLGGRATLVPFGDHNPDPGYAGVWAAYAVLVAPHAPGLAGRLAWMATAMGAVPTRPMPSAVDPCLGDTHLAGLGVLLRAPGLDGRPTLLALRSGGAWGHHHADDGSLMLYGAGRLLIGDAGRSHVVSPDPQRKFRADGHSRWMPDGLTPRNHLFRFSRGCCTAQDLTAAIPWAIAWSPVALVEDGSPDGRRLRHPLRHQRLVARLAPGLWLVSDAWDAGTPATIRWHLAGPARCDGGVATLDLAGDGGLSLQVLAPSTRLTLAGHDCGRDHPEALTSEIACAVSGDRCLTLIALGEPPSVRGGGREIGFGGRLWIVAAERDRVLVTADDGAHELPRTAADPA